MEVNLGESFDCNPPSRDAAWFTISKGSELYLPQSSVELQNFIYQVSHFPIPFNSVPNLSDVWVHLPENPSISELQQAINILHLGPTDGRLDWLYDQIAQLNEIDRSLTLLLLDGYSYKEMSSILGIHALSF